MSNLPSKKQNRKYHPKSGKIDIPLDTRADKIIDHYINATKLTDKLEEERQRLYEIWAQLANGNSPEIVKAAYMEQHSVSLRTVQRDINDAMRVHGEIQPINKNAVRHILYELSMRAYRLASQDGPPNVTEMNRAVKNMIDLFGLTKEDPEKIDWEQLEQHEIRIKMPKDMMVAMRSVIKTGAVDLDEIMDIPHEEID